MAHIDYYFSVLSPFAYLAGTRLEDVASARGASLRYKPLDIMTLFARTGGTSPKDRHPSRQAYRAQELRRQSASTGLALDPQPMFWPTNPAPASYAIISAQKDGSGDLGALVHGLMARIWAGNQDIAESDVIRAVLSETGFDPELADSGMLSASEEYSANLEDAVSANVFGAPFYVVGSETFWGQDRLPDLDAHLASA